MIVQRNVIFCFLFFAVLPGQGQQKVDIATSQASDGIRLGIFRHGWALVAEGQDTYYINAQGGKIRTMGGDRTPLGDVFAIEEYERQLEEHPNALPTKVIVFEQNGLRGIINPKGEVLVPAEYNHIDTEYQQFWKLFKHNKKAHYLPDGSTTAFFDDIGYLDGVYFDVKRGDEWHIYHHPSGRVITKAAYEGFDYCGGCGSPSPYVYAKKNGKWGIIDWKENILVPFAYDHEHRGMRSDAWVASFSKDGQPVIVHIPTQQVFDEGGELVSGTLIVSKGGKYGAYDRNGELTLPFEYDGIEAPNENHYLGYFGDYLVIERNRQKGIAGADGEIVLPAEYEEVMAYDDYLVASKEGQTALFRAGHAKPLLELPHAEISHVNDFFYSSGSYGLSILKIKQQAFYGLYFGGSETFIEPAYYDVSLVRNDYFPEGMAVMADRQGQKSLFSTRGELLVPFPVQEFDMFNSSGIRLLAVKTEGKWGLYDIHQGIEVLPCEYDRYFRVLETPGARFIRAVVEEDGQPDRYVLYGNDGHKVVEEAFYGMNEIGNNRFLLEMGDDRNTRYVLFDAASHELTELPYRLVAPSGSPQLLVVSDDDKLGRLYDIASGRMLDRIYDVFLFSGELTADAGLYDNMLEQPWTLQHFSDGLATVYTADGLIGAIDEQERVLIEPQYDRLRFVSTEYAIATDAREGYSFYVNRAGERIFLPGYCVDDVVFYNQEADSGHAVVVQKDPYTALFGLGNPATGEILAEAVYSELMPLMNYPYIITIQYVEGGGRLFGAIAKYGLATKEGQMLFEPIFDDIVVDDSGYEMREGDRSKRALFPLLVRQGDVWRYVNADGSYLPVEGDNRY